MANVILKYESPENTGYILQNCTHLYGHILGTSSVVFFFVTSSIKFEYEIYSHQGYLFVTLNDFMTYSSDELF